MPHPRAEIFPLLVMEVANGFQDAPFSRCGTVESLLPQDRSEKTGEHIAVCGEPIDEMSVIHAVKMGEERVFIWPGPPTLSPAQHAWNDHYTRGWTLRNRPLF